MMANSSDEESETYDNESLVTDDEDDVMPSDDDLDEEDDDDEDDLHDGKFNKFKIELKKDEMASDIEEDNEEGYLPNSQAWGKNKKLFYDTDYVDKDFRSQKQKDEDLAQYEEQEALAIQKRLIQSVNENDLGIEFLIDAKPSKIPISDVKAIDETKSGKIELDLTAIADREKLTIIKQESPELELLVSDLKNCLIELKTHLEPIIKCLLQHKAMPTSGLKYLKLRYFVLLNYCTNISFYLTLMSSQDKQNVKEHPIIKEIFMHKKLISELDSCFDIKGDKLSKELDFISKRLEKNGEIHFLVDQINDNLPDTIEIVKKKLGTIEDSDDQDNEADMMIDEDEDGKRAITREMEKNKGLIPKRKREQRNPRVKYRKKFEKAIIRRKGQVREPRKEMKKYGGELTGINARTVKSVKFR